MTNIHPLAVVGSRAELGRDVQVGPYCVVEDGVTLGDGCKLECHAVIKAGVTLGENNHIFDGAVIGGPPQHARCPQRTGTLRIGASNVIREFVTIHRALHEGEATVVGDSNLLMVSVHVAHDCVLGNHVIVVNNAMLAGHVTIGDQAYVAGAAGVHQHCRIGRLAMVGGQAHVNKDIPPFVTIDGTTTLVVGLNVVGLRRAGFANGQIDELKAAYRLIYRSGLPWQDMLARLKNEFENGPAAEFHDFFRTGKRGFTPERRVAPMLKLLGEEAEELRRKAG